MEVLQKLLEMVKNDAQRDDLWSDACFALIKEKKHFEAWTVFQLIKSDLAKIRCLLSIQPITPASFLLMMIYSPRKLKFSQRLRAIKAVFFDKDAPNVTDQHQLGETLLSVIWNNPTIIDNDMAIRYTINLLSCLTTDLRDIAIQKINSCLLEETDVEKRTGILIRLSNDLDEKTRQIVLTDALAFVRIDDQLSVDVWEIISQSVVDQGMCQANLFRIINLADTFRSLSLSAVIKWLPESAVETAREIIISYEDNSPILTAHLVNRMIQLGQLDDAKNLMQKTLQTASRGVLIQILPVFSKDILDDAIIIDALKNSLNSGEKGRVPQLVEKVLSIVSGGFLEQVCLMARDWITDADDAIEKSDTEKSELFEIILPYELSLGTITLEMVYEQIANLHDYYDKAVAYARLAGVVSETEQPNLIDLAKEHLALAKKPENWPDYMLKMTQYMGVLEGVPKEWAYKNPVVDYDLGIALHLAKVLPPEEGAEYWKIASRDDDIVKEIQNIPSWLFWGMIQYHFSQLESESNKIKFDTELVLEMYTKYIKALSVEQRYAAHIRFFTLAAQKGRSLFVLYLSLLIANNQDAFTPSTIERISNSLSMIRRWWK
jgi:hypothetical protein